MWALAFVPLMRTLTPLVVDMPSPIESGGADSFATA